MFASRGLRNELEKKYKQTKKNIEKQITYLTATEEGQAKLRNFLEYLKNAYDPIQLKIKKELQNKSELLKKQEVKAVSEKQEVKIKSREEIELEKLKIELEKQNNDFEFLTSRTNIAEYLKYLKLSLPKAEDMGIDELKQMNVTLAAGMTAIGSMTDFKFDGSVNSTKDNRLILHHAAIFYTESYKFYSSTSTKTVLSNAGLRVAQSSSIITGVAGLCLGLGICGLLSTKAAMGIGFGLAVGATVLSGGVALGIAAGCLAVAVLGYYLTTKVMDKIESNKRKAQFSESCMLVNKSIEAVHFLPEAEKKLESLKTKQIK